MEKSYQQLLGEHKERFMEMEDNIIQLEKKNQDALLEMTKSKEQTQQEKRRYKSLEGTDNAVLILLYSFLLILFSSSIVFHST